MADKIPVVDAMEHSREWHRSSCCLGQAHMQEEHIPDLGATAESREHDSRTPQNSH